MTLATRYFQPGTTVVVVVPSVASLASGATRAEINAGTDVSGDVAAINGFGVTSNQIDTPDLGGRFTKRVPGRLVAEDSSMVFYAGVTGADVRTVLTRDQNTYVAIFDGGDVAGRKYDIFKVTVGSVSKNRELEDAPRITASFTITDYAENIAVPA
jgi:hypothetical protein